MQPTIQKAVDFKLWCFHSQYYPGIIESKQPKMAFCAPTTPFCFEGTPYRAEDPERQKMTRRVIDIENLRTYMYLSSSIH